MKRKQLFNPTAKGIETLIGGDTTNVLNLGFADKKYMEFHKLVAIGESNQWKPEKVDMSKDVYDYRKRLSDDERSAYDAVLSFLVFLDSAQVNNLPNIFTYITNPHVVYFGARQAYEEANHSKSYGHILSSIMTKEEANIVVEKWKDNKILLSRIEYIAKIYQDFVDEPSEINFIKSVVANYLLEGVYFYNGFQFFHTLASRGLSVGTDIQICYIQRDELIHLKGFELIIKILFEENPHILTDEVKEIIKELFTTAVEWEIKFSKEFIGDKILGITSETIENYTYYIANKRLKDIGFEEIFPKCKNPYKHLEQISGAESEDSNRTNNFEQTSIQYKMPEILDGWDEL